MLQKVEIIGNIVADAEQKQGESGNEYLSFSVAVNDMVKKERTTTFYEIVSFHHRNILDYLRKGVRVYVCGRLAVFSYSSQDGDPRTRLCVNASDIELCGSSEH